MRKSKYNNRIAYAGGRRFDSVKEMQRWAFLQGEEREGRIRDLRCQVRYELTPVKACYVADFVYLMPDGVEVIEDVKGMLGSMTEPTFDDYAEVLRKLYVISDINGWCPAIRSAYCE